jgi:[ribosomal protein S5]-alanine N-acetyltransferase
MAELISGDIKLRTFKESDALRLAELANNPKIGRYLRDGFPYPYTVADARLFLSKFMQFDTFFAIEYKGAYVGNISLVPLENVYRKTAEIGYFLGEPWWNKGIMTTAVKLITDHGFKLCFARIHTGIYEYNPASRRVLEKCGYVLEGIFSQSIFKENRLWDEYRYAKINPVYLKTGSPLS